MSAIFFNNVMYAGGGGGGGGGGTGDTTSIEITQAEYDALSTSEKLDPTKVYYIVDGQITVGNISALAYQQLTPAEYEALSYADKTDGTIYFVSNESVGAKGLKVVEISRVDYNRLTPEQKHNGVPYFVQSN